MRRWPLVLLVSVTCLMVLTLTAAAVLQRMGGPARAVGEPPVPADASPTPLARPLAAPPGEGGYAVNYYQQDGVTPVRWDPCRPLHYVVNPAGAPPSADYLVVSAMKRIEQVTGQVIVFDGYVDEAPVDQREPVQRDRYGDRWAPLLIAWSEPARAPHLQGAVLGYAIPHYEPVSGPKRYVTGQIVLDSTQLAEMIAGNAGLARARGVVLHEFTHIFGLDHVDDQRQLMFRTTTQLGVDFGPGDLRGLAAVSGGPCFGEPG